MSGFKKRDKNLVYLTFGMLLMAVCCFRKLYYAGIVSAILFFCYFYYFLSNNRKLAIKYVFIFIAMALYSLGNLVCEYVRFYLVELGTISNYTGSFCLLGVLYWITTLTLLKLDPIISKKIKHSSRYNYMMRGSSLTHAIKKTAPIIVFSLGMVYWLLVIKHPSFLMDVNRFGYVSYMPRWLYKIRTIPTLLAPWIYFSVIDNNKIKNTGEKIRRILIIYLPYIIFGFWIGNKFGLFIDLIVAFLIPVAGSIKDSKIDKKKIINIGMYAVLGLSVLLFLFWSLRGYSILQMGTKLATRLSQQGEIWWAEVRNGDWTGTHFAEVGEEFESIYTSIITRGEIKTYGVYRLMNIYGNSSYLKAYLDIDMRLSAQGFELVFYYFGIFGFLIYPIVTSIVYSIIVNLYASSVRSRSFSAIVYYRIFILIGQSLTQGDWYRFTSALDILLLGLLLCDIVLRRTNGGVEIKKHLVKTRNL